MRLPMLIRILVVCIIALSVFIFVGYQRSIDTYSADETFLNEYSKAKSDHRVLIARRYASSLGFARMLEILESKFPLCHSQAHPIGKAVFQNTNSVSESVKICGHSCSDGCFHGLQMELFASPEATGVLLPKGKEDLQRTISEAITFCGRKDTLEAMYPWKCLHGVGHVVAFASGYQLRSAIEACSTLPDHTASLLCAGGVFMELMNEPLMADRFKRKAYEPCDSYPHYSSACYRYKGAQMVLLLGKEGTRRACMKLPEISREGCIRGYGFSVATLEVLASTKNLEKVCEFGNERDREACIDGAISRIALNIDMTTDEGCSQMSVAYRGRCEALLKQVRDYRLIISK